MDPIESTPPPDAQPPLPTTGPDSEQDDIAKNKDLAAFSYLWIMSVVVFFLRRNSPFARFHAQQAMVLFLISIIVWFVPVINRILELGVLCLMVVGFVNAAQGKKQDVPIVGPLSRREIGVRQAWKQLVDAIVRLVGMLKSEKPAASKASPASHTPADHPDVLPPAPASPPPTDHPSTP